MYAFIDTLSPCVKIICTYSLTLFECLFMKNLYLLLYSFAFVFISLDASSIPTKTKATAIPILVATGVTCVSLETSQNERLLQSESIQNQQRLNRPNNIARGIICCTLKHYFNDKEYCGIIVGNGKRHIVIFKCGCAQSCGEVSCCSDCRG